MVLSSFPRLSETFIVNKFVGLVRAGLDVHVVCSHFNKRDWQHFGSLHSDPTLRQRIHVTPSVRPRWLVPLLWLLSFAKLMIRAPSRTTAYFIVGWKLLGQDIFRQFYLDQAIVRVTPSIIHFEFGTLAVDRMHLREVLKCKTVVSFRGYDINYVGLESEPYYRAVWDKADHLHFLGKDLWRRALKRGCPLEKPYSFIPPAIDLHFFEPSNEETDTNGVVILSVGRLTWKKGYEDALTAIRHLKDAGYEVHYRIIGDGDMSEALYFCRHQLDLVEEVSFLGALPHNTVLDEMTRAHIFLHAAASEGFCNAVLEAQAMKLPVVTTDADGLGENVADGVTGFVVPRRQPRKIAEKLSDLIDDPALRQRMGEAGRQRVEENFSLSEQIEKFRVMYTNIHGNPT